MPSRPRKLPFILFAVSLGLLVLGITLGEVPVVLEKAVSICLSCIGIG